ncbi:MAG: hypothetical protein ABR84_06230 [Cryomorphaceae bacterium BACL21 MAG-121220-bin10]|jgi:glycosyltransferase involved in cell wall biosynthesis|nr:MAG: hypothetical protein ABR84_06230 [Cryomorphaceae bacterium BACL21 MAG-121220-bin10]
MPEPPMLLFFLTGAFAFINLLFFYRFYGFTQAPIGPESLQNYPVSVLICAKNQADNLGRLLPLISAQRYSNFEIIVVNDGSTDHTQDLLEAYALTDKRLEIVTIKPNETFWGNKKYALTLGIKKAQYQRLLFTDADCIPCSDQWMKRMTAPMTDKNAIVLGYSGYEKKPGLLNALIRYETVMTACQYLGHAWAKMPYMGVGRNLAYTKPLFFEQKGFVSHMDIPSGDDDLFVNKAAATCKTYIVFEPSAQTQSIPKTTWASFIRQKRRHITTAHHYQWHHQLVLGFYALSLIGFWSSAVLGLIVHTPLNFLLTIVILRIGLQQALLAPCFRALKERSMVWLLFIFEPLLLCFQLIVFILNLFSKPPRWK